MPLVWATGISYQPTKADYATDVAPIFRAHCSPCHTGKEASGGLSLNDYDSLMKSGVVAKGSAKSSTIVQRILGEGGLPRMPMGFKPLDPADIARIRGWIDAGAQPPRAKAQPGHWAYVPPKKAQLPSGAKNPIDAFVIAKLRQEGLRLSPPADKATLLRRVTLDLTGLPPMPAELEAFASDKSPYAYEKVVDRLLASPHYGERMALPWLDAARYADSNGFQQDGDTYQYVWRDWLVRALNANMRFDRMTIAQIAGDLLAKPTLDQLVATGFNRNHMLNGEGGAIPEEQRYVNLFDRVDTTAMTWMSLTMGCARCHDHKYDPITQRDYYAMMAYFNQVPETGVPSGSGQYRIADPWIYAGTPAEMTRLAGAERALVRAKAAETALLESPEIQQEFRTWRDKVVFEVRQAKVVASPWRDLGAYKAATFDEAFDRKLGPEAAVVAGGEERLDLADGRVNALSGDNTAFYFERSIKVDRPIAYLLSLGSDDGIKVWLDGREVLSRKVTRGVVPDSDRIVVTLTAGDHTLRLKIVNGGGVGGFYYRGLVGGVGEETASQLASDSPEVQKKALQAFIEQSQTPGLRQRLDATREAEEALTKVRERTPRVMIMSDKMPRATHVLRRGNYEDPIDRVEPATPAFLPKEPGPGNRLGLARWIVSPENPLTARVQVNRAWQVFFGRGLVRTEENFGVKGEPPTHPELLDWLAVDFRENGWNLKRLHKQIVMSATYRQSSKVTPELLKRDPANLLLARALRYRLSAMILRDVALAASGLLNRKIGGKPVYPYQPAGIWDGLAITLERDFTYPQSKGRDNYRRSLYTFWRRTAAPGDMFDSSTRQVCTVRPTLTSSPMHALTMLNNVAWVEAGIALADSVSGIPTATGRLSAAFFRVCSRRPSAGELKILERAFARALASFRGDSASTASYLAQGEFRASQSTPELAALASVCTAIFNLSEAVTRE
ncbi:MAG: hypothetical protein HONBIEJF_01899 [Fimbriimonadaceae bacterium]|nr:hypothetical protein [Fimbriimonadaceae bacterium]